jgi:ribosomal protein S18 acetylase RimI-like enzyme
MHSTATGKFQIDRCDPAAEKEVLAIAAQAWPEVERAAYWQAIAALVRGGQSDRVVLLAARQGDRLLAAQLGQSLPGRVAAAWPPQFTAGDTINRDQITGQLFARLTSDLAATGAQMAQALLADGDEPAQRLFAIGGFKHAADLLYLAAGLNESPEIQMDWPFEIETFRPRAEGRLARLIEETYVGSLDCPWIDGLRQTADVLAGYQAVGEFRPELWHLVRHHGDDVGCLLINLHRDVGHAEIVYLALIPSVRGRGWGLALARLAQHLAGDAGCKRLVLAVDAANMPALRLYAAAGFEVFDRRAVWINRLV